MNGVCEQAAAEKNSSSFAPSLLDRAQHHLSGADTTVAAAPALPLAASQKAGAHPGIAMALASPSCIAEYLGFMRTAEELYPDFFAQLEAFGGMTTWSLEQIEAFAATAPHPFLAGWVWGRMFEMLSAGQFTRAS
ncbi:hypothetical protein QRD43_21010 [Pelomonas sp. APW6]|uniref:Uncharacterized protein n=1 Tax=Roseateles subflavus TaxID=3053353 RepID=A0ABT7LNE8_9BURK|nr:hypothetical protein [Pelomonas sp. APW6]MDL5034396.1 hypothetical protein [Pelomonas sp. APW6]